jgi:tRNA nucleotidyltransferase (CCA-adding enzyme)
MQFLENLPFDINLLPKPVYVVGGAVRDSLLGRVRAELDLDLVIPIGAVEVARKLAAVYQAGFVLLDPERQIARVVFPEMTVDIAQQDGASITDDLNRRDYTLNAIAYDLQTGETIDPLSGTQDIQQGMIRMVRTQNLVDDPLRLLRAYRQAAQLNFTIEANTRDAIRELAPLLTTVAAERVLMELRYLLQTPNSSEWFAKMIEDKLLTGWLKIPVDTAFKNQLTQFDRSFELVKQRYPTLAIELERPVRDTISTTRRSIGKLTILLSPELAVATEQLLSLTFSSAEIQVITNVINYLPQLSQSELSLPEQYFWFKSVGNDFPLLIVLAIASGIELVELVDLIDRYLDPHSQVAHPTALVNGHDLTKLLSIAPSPLIGKLLTEIQLARIAGKIATQSDAIEFARELLTSSKLNPKY